ncbi:MAG: hypothetical protein A3E80_02445 [Chlamydiae bacterium RIFCSPHIGHO2_12_FULL_49_9]|nr:MAG: hypothetical protein A3E80_02445 [Chlamydiae bacterium RIFCSPHIGHO2_12_FULL_49_9]
MEATGLGSYYYSAKEKISYGCSFICDGAKIVGESIATFSLIHIVSMVSPSMGRRLELISLRISHVWQRVKAHFEKKALGGEIEALKRRISILERTNKGLIAQLESANRLNEYLVKEQASLRGERDLYQKIADVRQAVTDIPQPLPDPLLEKAKRLLDSMGQQEGVYGVRCK